MTNIAKVTTLEIATNHSFEAARALAIEQFAGVAVEEIMLQAAERRLAVLEHRRQLVLHHLKVGDLVALGDKLAKTKYGAEKIHEIFGGTFELLKDPDGKPIMDTIIITNDPDVGEVRIFSFFGRYTRGDGKSVESIGSFSTKDPFFAKAQGAWKRLDEIDIVSVMVAAQSECYKKAILRGSGVGDFDVEDRKILDDVKAAGQGHDFKGSQAGAGKTDARVGFGKEHKGKLVTDLDDAALTWYEKAYRENVEDPDKKKWAKSNKEILDAIVAEKAHRAAPKTPAPDSERTQVENPAPVGDGAPRSDTSTARTVGAPASTEAHGKPALAKEPAKTGDEPVREPAAETAKGKTRGQLISEVYDLLNKANEGKPKGAAATLRLLCLDFDVKETGNISDIPDEMLRKVALMTVEDLKKFQRAAGLV